MKNMKMCAAIFEAFSSNNNKKKESISDLNFPIDFCLITVNSIYACTLVIAAQQEEVLGIFDFVGEQQANCLERLLSWKIIEKEIMKISSSGSREKVLTSINVIAEKEIVGLGRKAAVFEQSQQV